MLKNKDNEWVFGRQEVTIFQDYGHTKQITLRGERLDSMADDKSEKNRLDEWDENFTSAINKKRKIIWKSAKGGANWKKSHLLSRDKTPWFEKTARERERENWYVDESYSVFHRTISGSFIDVVRHRILVTRNLFYDRRPTVLIFYINRLPAVLAETRLERVFLQVKGAKSRDEEWKRTTIHSWNVRVNANLSGLRGYLTDEEYEINATSTLYLSIVLAGST